LTEHGCYDYWRASSGRKQRDAADTPQIFLRRFQIESPFYGLARQPSAKDPTYNKLPNPYAIGKSVGRMLRLH